MRWKKVSGTLALALFLSAYWGGCGGEGEAIDRTGETSEDLSAGTDESYAANPLDTIITSQPENPSNSCIATFSFICNRRRCSFKCKIDSKAWQRCKSPQTYCLLPGGNHSFKVKAKNLANGLWDKTPALYTWEIKDIWLATSTVNAPSPRRWHTAVWTGTEMIIWGGKSSINLNTGARYNPSTDLWTQTSTTNAPSARHGHTAIWTGAEMIVWGANPGTDTGGIYNPFTDSWMPTSTTNAPSGRVAFSAVWTGDEMIIWGGQSATGFENTGGRYNPLTNSWIAISTTNAPSKRWLHTAVWTGSQMIVWGGYDGFSNLNTGGRYSPLSDSWNATSNTNAPSVRFSPSSIWTGTEMIIWGGDYFGGGYHSLNTGGKYNPSTNSWNSTSITNAPSSRVGHTAVWTGTEMIVWGGFDEDSLSIYNNGGKYNPLTDSWTATSTCWVPGARYSHSAAWTGNEMIIWGGYDGSSYLNTGGRYWP